MEHVTVMSDDPGFSWNERVVLDLHFDACIFQRDKSPGRWRTGPMIVTRGNGRVAYAAPDADELPSLMMEFVDWLEHGNLDEHVVVRAALAHLNLVSVHPFRDGNGRVSRIVQSLVLARDGLLAPEFGSIEPWLAADTGRYYRLLESVQGGSWQPDRDPSEWIDACIEAHIHQATARIEHAAAAARRFGLLERLVEDRGWDDRHVIALEQAMSDVTSTATYIAEADVSSPTAASDFGRLVDAGWLRRLGKGRATRYEATPELRKRVAAGDD